MPCLPLMRPIPPGGGNVGEADKRGPFREKGGFLRSKKTEGEKSKRLPLSRLPPTASRCDSVTSRF